MRVSDLTQRPGVTFESQEDRLSMDTPLFRGEFWHRELRRGLHLHASDVFEEAGFTANSSQNAGVSCVFFLSGDVNVAIGDRNFHFQGAESRNQGLIISSARLESFCRRSRGHQQIRHLVVSASPEWLDRDGLSALDDHRPAEALLRDHLASQSWQLTRRLASLVSRIMKPAAGLSALHELMVESAAVEIVAEALAASTHQEPMPRSSMLSATETIRLRQAEQFIEARQGQKLHVEDIAQQSGVSVSGLQRLFQAKYGTSVLDHIRQVRLDDAKRMLEGGDTGIQQVAALAGYSSAANFATAFKRRFGRSPSEIAAE
ncbi:AraC family transcriptional regulator [Tianweitania sp.]|uniref:helix-turn-helix transcriptional regulator n=1 Tax=Tianweitania sp. TaxID=2021634 RepID=UPI002899542F|nr:AraC family transcriptional regulator [Tianweitania sp.]